MNKIWILILMLGLFLPIGFASALSVESITVDNVSPGEEGVIRVELENDGNTDIKRLSFRLTFPQTGIIPIGSSEESVDEIKEDDEETLVFRFKTANDIPVGTYSISYSMTYEESNDEFEQKGSIGIVVSAEPELEIVLNSQNAIVGQQGELNVRVVNKGLADARFVNIFIESNDLTILSENSEYIGTIDSDDFETSSFDVIYTSRFPSVSVKLTYKDFNNIEQEITETASLRAYTYEEAVEKGILKRSNAPIYVGIVIALLVIWFVYMAIRKRRKNKEQ